MNAILEPIVILTQALKVPPYGSTFGYMRQVTEKAEFSARLNAILDDLGVPPKFEGRQVEVARLFGVTQKGARKWLEGESIPAYEVCVEVARRAGVHYEWLMTGRGPKHIKPPDQPQPPTLPPELANEAFDFLEFKGRKFYSGEQLAAYLRWLDRLLKNAPPKAPQ